MFPVRFSGLLILAVIYPFPAEAYVDPGIGNMIVQMIIGGVAGALVVLKLYWQRLKSLFTDISSRAEKGSEDQ